MKLKYLSLINKITVLILSAFMMEVFPSEVQAVQPAPVFEFADGYSGVLFGNSSDSELDTESEIREIPSDSTEFSRESQFVPILRLDTPHLFERVLSDRRVDCFASIPVRMNSETEERINRLSNYLNETFSVDDHCPICMEDWNEQISLGPDPTVLVTDNCDCRYFFCENCSTDLARRANDTCPACRSRSASQRLFFVVHADDAESD